MSTEIQGMYSDMPSAIYEWIKNGHAWTPAWEWYISGDCALDYRDSEFFENKTLSS